VVRFLELSIRGSISCIDYFTIFEARVPIAQFDLLTYNVRAVEPTASPKTRRIEVRLSDEERQLDAAAASALGESLSDFFRRAAQTRAQEVLADQRVIALGEEEAARFLDALERPDEGTVARLEDLRRRA
jgi:uncharacterized protein (DUF1778 family)